MTARLKVDRHASLFSDFTFSLPDLLHAISRYRVRALLAFVSAIVIGLITVLVTMPLYESRAVILIKFGRGQVYRPELGSDTPIVPTLSEHDGMVDNQVQMFHSRDVIGPVIKSIGVMRLYPDLATSPRESEFDRLARRAVSDLKALILPLVTKWGLPTSFFDYAIPHDRPIMEDAVRRFGRNLSVSRDRTSDLVQVAFRHPDPKLAQAALRAVLIQQHWLSTAVHGGAKPEFYEAAISDTKNQLSEAQTQLSRFRAANGVLAFNEQLPLMLRERGDLDKARRQAEADLVDIGQRIKMLEQQRPTLPAEVLDFKDTQTASHFVGTTRWTRNNALMQLDVELQRSQAGAAGLRGRVVELTTQIAAIDTDLLKAGERDARRLSLQNEIATEEASLRSLTIRREEARMQNDLDRREAQNLVFVQAPTLPDLKYPVRPAPVTYMLLAVLCGLASALTVIVTSAMFSRRPQNAMRDPATVVLYPEDLYPEDSIFGSKNRHFNRQKQVQDVS